MVLLVVDTQTLITNDKLYMFDWFTENIKSLIAAARKNDVEVIFVCHDDGEGQALSKGAEDYEIYGEFKPLDGEKIFDKTVNSAFLNTGLTEYLNGRGEKEIMAVGLQTDYCIDATVKCGFERGFRMIVPEYCNSTFDNEFMTAETSYHYYNEFIWKDRYADCVSVKSALEMLNGRAK